MAPARRALNAFTVSIGIAVWLLLGTAASYAAMPSTPLPARADKPIPAPPSPDTPKLDIEAMRLSVRSMQFDERKQEPMGSVLSAVPSPALEGFREKFDSGKRPWCLTRFQGLGTLALIAMPLASLLDKKDHGCKW